MEVQTLAQNSGDFIDTDSEKCFLGALLLNWSVMGEVSSKVHPEDLYYICNKLIYATMQSLYGKVPEVNYIILIDELRKQNHLDEAGGPAYITSLTDQVPSSVNIDYYIKNIKECKANREIRNISGEINDSLASNIPTNDIIEQAKRRLEDIQANSSETEIITASGLIHEANKRIANNIATRGEPRGITTGFVDFDGMLGGGFKRKHLVILAARPSIGKTAMALNLLENSAAKGYKSGFISLEMTREELSNRLISQCSGVPGDKLLSGFVSTDQYSRLGKATDYLSHLPMVLAENHGIGISEVCGIIRNMVLKHQVEIVYIDYLGLIRSGRNNIQQWQELGLFTEELRDTAIAMNIPVVLLCQLNRNAEEDEPTLADLKGSGEIEQHADEVIMIHGKREFNPDEPKAERIIIIGKQRNGITGRFKMDYIGALTKFQNAA